MTIREGLSNLFPIEEVMSLNVNVQNEILNVYLGYLFRASAMSALLAPRAVLVANVLKAIPVTQISNLTTYTDYAFSFFPYIFDSIDKFIDSFPVIGPYIGIPTGLPVFVYGYLHQKIDEFSSSPYLNSYGTKVPIIGHEIVPILLPLASIVLLQYSIKWLANKF